MVSLRVLAGAPMLTAAAVAVLWRAVRSTRPAVVWFDQPLPDDVLSTPALAAEHALQARLLRGDLNGAGYRREMETLAARDVSRRPLIVPEPGRS
jgi:hypothetical protein